MIVNNQGYVSTGKKTPKKNFWTIREDKYYRGIVVLNAIYFPPSLIGRKVRFKVEIE